MLAEARGDKDRYKDLLYQSSYVYEYTVTGTGGQWYSYTHFDPTDLTHRILQYQRESVMMIETLIHVAADGSLEFKFVGDREGFARSTSPDAEEYEIELLEIGEHHAHMDDLFACLTERQREVLDCAVRCGYYQNPRLNVSSSLSGKYARNPSV